MTALLNQGDPGRQNIDRMLRRAREWTSDYYKAGLLRTLARRDDRDAIWASVWGVADTIESDYYIAQVAAAYLDAGTTVASEQMERLLGRLDSDYYRAQLVKAARDNSTANLGPIALMAARDTKSAYYRTEILSQYLRDGRPATKDVIEIIRLAGELDSDYYCAQLLREVARTSGLDAAATDPYRDVAEKIQSKYYRQQALDALGRTRR